jgi:hypothetical protein
MSATSRYASDNHAYAAQTSAEVTRLAIELARNFHYAVFPCGKNKTPIWPKHLGGRGYKDASTNPDRIAWLWRNYPGPLIGVATGVASGFDVLDIDPRHESAVEWWHRNHTRLPVTFAYRTRSGGVHLAFKHAPGLRCSAGREGGRLPLGVDVRADGGYIIYWPAAGSPVLDSVPIAPWPAWLLDLLRKPRAERAEAFPRVLAVSPDRAIDGLIRTVSTAREGTRNARLFWSSCRLSERVRAGEIGQREAEALLLDAARVAGLPVLEAQRTIASAFGREP